LIISLNQNPYLHGSITMKQQPVRKYAAQKVVEGQPTVVEDALTVEVMLSIYINGEPFTITMHTPGDEEALARGLLLGEQVYTEKENPTFTITEVNDAGYITAVQISGPAHLFHTEGKVNRTLVSVSSCGMCGKTEAELLLTGVHIPAHDTPSAERVQQMFRSMREHQNTFNSSGGSHASAIFDEAGKLLVIKEDIGRHNAVDKAIGQLALEGRLPTAHCIIVSGRVSYEIVSKTYRAGIPVLAAVSAPSSLAVESCKTAGITLLAFCREDRFTNYS
jgi:FdhD protein